MFIFNTTRNECHANLRTVLFNLRAAKWTAVNVLFPECRCLVRKSSTRRSRRNMCFTKFWERKYNHKSMADSVYNKIWAKCKVPFKSAIRRAKSDVKWFPLLSGWYLRWNLYVLKHKQFWPTWLLLIFTGALSPKLLWPKTRQLANYMLLNASTNEIFPAKKMQSKTKSLS